MKDGAATGCCGGCQRQPELYGWSWSNGKHRHLAPNASISAPTRIVTHNTHCQRQPCTIAPPTSGADAALVIAPPDAHHRASPGGSWGHRTSDVRKSLFREAI
jgi:hypothetical protein